MTDPWIALAVLVLVLIVFMAALLVPRRPREVRVPVTDAKLDAIHIRLSTIEGNLGTIEGNLGTIETHQVSLEKRQTSNDHDVRNIRMAMQSMPTKDSLNQVRLEVAGLNGKVDGMHDTLQTNGHSLRRIEDFLINAAVTNIAGKGSEAKS